MLSSSHWMNRNAELSMRFWSLPSTMTTAFVAAAVPGAGNHQPFKFSPSRLWKDTSSYVGRLDVCRGYFHEIPR